MRIELKDVRGELVFEHVTFRYTMQTRKPC